MSRTSGVLSDGRVRILHRDSLMVRVFDDFAPYRSLGCLIEEMQGIEILYKKMLCPGYLITLLCLIIWNF